MVISQAISSVGNLGQAAAVGRYGAAQTELLELHRQIAEFKVALRTDRSRADELALEIQRTVKNSPALSGFDRIACLADEIVKQYNSMPQHISDWSADNKAAGMLLLMEKGLDEFRKHLVCMAFEAGMLSKLEAGQPKQVAEFLNRQNRSVPFNDDFLKLFLGYLNKGTQTDNAIAKNLLQYSFDEGTLMVPHPLAIDPEMPMAYSKPSGKDLAGDLSNMAHTYSINPMKPLDAQQVLAQEVKRLASIEPVVPFFKPIELEPEKSFGRTLNTAFFYLDNVEWGKVFVSLLPGMGTYDEWSEAIAAMKAGDYEKMTLHFLGGLAFAGLDVAAIMTGGFGKGMEAIAAGAKAIEAGSAAARLAESIRVIAKAAKAGRLTRNQMKEIAAIVKELDNSGAMLKEVGKAARTTGPVGAIDLKYGLNFSKKGNRMTKLADNLEELKATGNTDKQIEVITKAANNLGKDGKRLLEMGKSIERGKKVTTLVGLSREKPVAAAEEVPENVIRELKEPAFKYGVGEEAGREIKTFSVNNIQKPHRAKLDKLIKEGKDGDFVRVASTEGTALKKSYYVIQKKGDEIYVYYLKDWKANERLLGGATQHISEKIAEKVASGGKKVSEKLDDAQNYIKKGTDWLFERAGDNTNIIYNQSNRWKISRKFWAKEGGVSEFAKDNMMGRAFTGTKGSVIVQATNPARFMTGVLQAGTGTALYTVGLAGSLARGYLYTIAEQQLIRVGAKPGFVIMEGVLEKPYENAKDFVINVRMRNLHKDRYTYVPAWQPEFNNVVNIMSGGTKEEKEKRLSAYMNEQGLTGKTEKETKETLHGWAQTLPAGLKKQPARESKASGASYKYDEPAQGTSPDGKACIWVTFYKDDKPYNGNVKLVQEFADGRMQESALFLPYRPGCIYIDLPGDAKKNDVLKFSLVDADGNKIAKIDHVVK